MVHHGAGDGHAEGLARAGLGVSDIDLFEINEAFAVVGLAAIRELDLDPPRSTSTAARWPSGHPIGASGARILVTLLHAMEQRGARAAAPASAWGAAKPRRSS